MSLVLCRLEDIPDGEGKGFELEPADADRLAGGAEQIFVVRQGERIYGYVNACPHLSTPLDWVEDQFMTQDKRGILCATHGAMFRIDDGFCVAGPCEGDSLSRLGLSCDESGHIILRGSVVA